MHFLLLFLGLGSEGYWLSFACCRMNSLFFWAHSLINLVYLLLGYIKDYQVYDLHRVGRITVELQGRVKDCKALTYRQDIKARDIENYRLRMLPTHQVCHILMFNILSWMLVFPFYIGKGLGEEWALCLCC